MRDWDHLGLLGEYNDLESIPNKMAPLEIDSAEIVPVTKFAYLKSYLTPKVRASIDGLPFTTEWYERAKNILKAEYGKVSEIVNRYITNIMGLPIITTSCPAKVNEFYKTLRYNVQSLETLGRLKEVSGNARSVLEKLKGIKMDLVRGDNRWQDWDFDKLLKALNTWREINPVEPHDVKAETSRRHGSGTRVKVYQTRQVNRGCVYCENPNHKSVDCPEHTTLDGHKKILAIKRF